MAVSIVWCDFGFLPGYLTLVLYIIILFLVHKYVLRVVILNKESAAKAITRKIKFLKGKEKIINKYLPVLLIVVLFLLMFFLYPVITNKNCPHHFWRMFGIGS